MSISDREKARLNPAELPEEPKEIQHHQQEGSLTKWQEEIQEDVSYLASELNVLRKALEVELQAQADFREKLLEAKIEAEQEKKKSVDTLRKVLEEVKRDLIETKQQRELRGTEYLQAGRDILAKLAEVMIEIRNVEKVKEKPALKERLLVLAVQGAVIMVGGIIVSLLVLNWIG